MVSTLPEKHFAVKSISTDNPWCQLKPGRLHLEYAHWTALFFKIDFSEGNKLDLFK